MIYFGGDHIQIVEKYASSRISPNSLGFIVCLKGIKRNSLSGMYDAVFYRIGKTGKPRLTIARQLFLPLIEYDIIKLYYENLERELINCAKGTHYINLLDKIDLLKCSSINFIGYLASKWIQLYTIVDLVRPRLLRPIIYDRNVINFDEFIARIERAEESLSSIMVTNDKLLPSYYAYIVDAMNYDDIKKLLINKYDNSDVRIRELRDLQRIFASFSGILREYLQHIFNVITMRESNIRRGNEVVGVNPNVAIEILQMLRNDIHKRFVLL